MTGPLYALGPPWLDRHLPQISIEGKEYFAKRDADAPPPGPEPAPAQA
jgi:hypothetical protein